MHRFALLSVAATAASITVGAAHAAVLYDSTTGTGLTNVLVRPHIPPSSGDLTGEGDDYATGSASLKVTGLSFRGAVGPSTNFVANFYNAAGGFVTSVAATAADGLNNTIGLQTLGAADFGAGGITVPGAGYVVFSVTSTDGVNRPSFNLGYQADAATTGVGNPATSARLDYQGTFSTGAYVTGNVFVGGTFVQVPANVAQFQLTGTAVPEPASLGALALASTASVIRRRRAR